MIGSFSCCKPIDFVIKLFTRSSVSINVMLEGVGTPGICGAFDFSEEFWSKSPLWSPKIWSNQIKYTHLENSGENRSRVFV